MAFVYHGGAPGFADGNTAPRPMPDSRANQAGAVLGVSVATAGDVNGDGYADVIVGAPRYDNGPDERGRAFVFLGVRAGVGSATRATARHAIEANQAGAVAWALASPRRAT